VSKSTELNRIEYDVASGAVSIRWEKKSSDGDSLGWHRTVVSDYVDPATNNVTPVSVAQQLAAVDDHLSGEGFAPISPDDAVLAHALREFGKTPLADIKEALGAAALAAIDENKGLASDKAILEADKKAAEEQVKALEQQADLRLDELAAKDAEIADLQAEKKTADQTLDVSAVMADPA